MEEKKGFLERSVERCVDIIYSREKRGLRMLLLLMGIGFILRLIAALHEDLLADDAVYASQSAGILHAGILSTHSNPPLFFYLTDIAYKIFGYTTFAARFWPLIAGTLLIGVVFLIGRKLFNEKVGLGAAFFATFANFLVRMTFTEQALVVFFFVFLGIYAGLWYIDTKKLSWLLLAGTGFGLGVLTKYNSPFFVLSFLCFVCIVKLKEKERIISKVNGKHLIIFLLIMGIFTIPFLAFNYLLYQDKGLVDVYFSRLVHVEKAQALYKDLAGQERSFFDNLLSIGNYGNYNIIYKTDIVLLLFSLLGILFWIRKKEWKALYFLAIFLVIPFILQSAGAPLQKHFAFMYLLASLPAGYALYNVRERVKNNYLWYGLIAIMTAIMIVNLGSAYGVPSNYFTSSPSSQLKSFVNNEVKAQDLLVLDGRIYTAKSFWLVADKQFIMATQFGDVYKANQQLQEQQRVPTSVYVVECAIDDCGWGWVAQQPEFNSSQEEIISAITTGARAKLVKSISAEEFKDNELYGNKQKKEVYKIYRTELDLSPQLLSYVTASQSFYFVPYLYKNMDSYILSYTKAGSSKLLHLLGAGVIWISIFLTVAVIMITLYLSFKAFK